MTTCLSMSVYVCLSVRKHIVENSLHGDPDLHQVLVHLMSVTRPSSGGGVAICCVGLLPVLWMTSRFLAGLLCCASPRVLDREVYKTPTSVGQWWRLPREKNSS